MHWNLTAIKPQPPVRTSADWRLFVFALSLCAVLLPHPTIAKETNLSDILFERALVTVEQVEEAISLEEALRQKSAILPDEGETWFSYLLGSSRILVVAPHATKPKRDGALRFADGGSGSLAIMLNRIAGTPVLHTTLASPSDPNYYDDNAFKQELDQLIKALKPVLVLDLHTSHAYRPYDVDFGTMRGASLKGKPELLLQLAEALRKEGIANFSQDYFPAAKNATVTKWVAARGVPCIQLEISETWLTPVAGKLEAHRFSQLLQALTRFVIALDAEIALAEKRLPNSN